MSNPSSEYNFPIFISSTDYNLIDLRAELARYLFELGYRPILSSSEAFPDYSPDYEPWESCLQVLKATYVMVLVIDDKYGKTFKWPSFKNEICDREVSPTHAEYLFAHKNKMRMLVFIRSNVLTHYQSYRSAMENAKNDKAIAKENLAKVLPKNIKFETLEFVEEVKTTDPIPWIKAFDDVTDIKKEIQKKMLNALADVFLFKSQHMEAIIREFSKMLDDLPEEKRKEILSSIGATKELIEKIENQTKTIQVLKKSEEHLEGKLTDVNNDLEKAKKAKKAVKDEFDRTIAKLNSEIREVKSKIKIHEEVNADYVISGSTAASGSVFPSAMVGSPSYLFAGSSNAQNINPAMLAAAYVTFDTANANSVFPGGYAGPKCDKCHRDSNSNISLVPQSLIYCPTCKRNLCNTCFYGASYTVNVSYECYDCRNKNPDLASVIVTKP